MCARARARAQLVCMIRRGEVAVGVGRGIAETTTGFYISTGYKDVPGLVLLLIVLAVKPAGLFGKTVIKKV